MSVGGARRLIGAGATTLLVGIGVAATGESLLGGIVVVPSLVLLIYALHRFGRTGPDDPIELGDA